MSGLEAIEVSFSELNCDLRIDAQYFQKQFLKDVETVHRLPTAKIVSIAKVADGDHSKFPDNQLQEIRYLQAKDIRDYFLNDTDPEFVSRDYFLRQARSHIFEENILFSIMGTVGGVTITPKGFQPCMANRAVGIIKDIKRLNPQFLFAFLITRYAVSMIERESSGGVQERINLDALGEVRVPLLSDEFQISVAKFVNQAHQKRAASRALVDAAQHLLFEQLGLAEWKPEEPIGYVKSYCEAFGEGNRLDAEYFRPRYQSLLALLRRQGKTLRDVARLREDMFKPQPGQPFHYIEIGDLAADGAATSHVVPGEEAPSRATWIVQPGDVITSTVRPNRCLTGLIEPEQAENICSSGFAVLTPKGIPGELLFAYLRLPVICELMDLHTTASMYPAISTTDLMRLPFLLPDEATIKKMKQQITAARAARREAHALLEKAKQAVELPIEKGEAAGLAALK